MRALLVVVALVVFMSSGAAVAADPVEVQASTLYYRDGRTILARVGTQNHSDVSLSVVPVVVRHAAPISGS